MKNCLVTKLKGVVNNDNLEVFNHFKVTFGTGAFSLKLKNTEEWTIDCDNTTDQINYGSSVASFPITSSSVGDYNFSGTLTKDTTFDICSKYAITAIEVASVKVKDMYDIAHIPLTEFNYHPDASDVMIDISKFIGKEMKVLRVNTSYISGNLKLADVVTPAMTEILLNTSGVSGNISVFGGCSNITSIYLQNSNISGSLEGLLETLYANGRQSTNLILNLRGTSLTSSIPFYNAANLKVVFSASGCEVRNNSNNDLYASYNGSTWTYENV